MVRYIILGLLLVLVGRCGSNTPASNEAPSPNNPNDSLNIPLETEEAKQIKELFQQSYKAWQTLSASRTGYEYTVYSSIPLSFYSLKTVIIVDSGRVVQRTVTLPNGSPSYSDGTSSSYQPYDETGAALGTHSYGAEILTINQLYEKCREKVITKANEKEYKASLTLDAESIFTYCQLTYRGKAPADSFGFVENIKIQDRKWR